jgi:hypothetical protein
MRAIGAKSSSRRVLCTAALVTLSVSVLPLYADRPGDVLATISYVAASLSAGNPIDAMTPFDKSFLNYAKLRDYFSGLTDSSQLVNDVDVTDEQGSSMESNVTVAWTLTLMNKTTGQTEQRSRDIHIRLTLQNGKWKITNFSPIELFNPQSNRLSK